MTIHCKASVSALVRTLTFLAAAGLAVLGLSRFDAARGIESATADIRFLRDLADGRPTFLYIFQPADCFENRWQVARWSELSRRGDVRVMGIPLRVGDVETEVHAAAPGLVRFPLAVHAAVPAERTLLRMGYARTPVGILVDAHGSPRLVIPPAANALEQDEWEQLVLGYTAVLAPRSTGPRRFSDGSRHAFPGSSP